MQTKGFLHFFGGTKVHIFQKKEDIWPHLFQQKHLRKWKENPEYAPF